jgi:hypothetical protein
MSISGHHRLTLAEAISIAKRGRRLLRTGRITAKAYVVLDCLLWACREPATGRIVVSYSALQRLCHCARETVSGALRVLMELGVLTKIKRRIRVAWAHGGSASRQLTSAYVLHPGADTESNGRPVIQKTIEKKEAPDDRQPMGQGRLPDLLAARRSAWAAGLVGIGAATVKAW